MDVRDVEVEIGSDLFGRLPGVDDPTCDVMNADPSPLDPRRTAENLVGRDDFGHTDSYWLSCLGLWPPGSLYGKTRRSDIAGGSPRDSTTLLGLAPRADVEGSDGTEVVDIVGHHRLAVDQPRRGDRRVRERESGPCVVNE